MTLLQKQLEISEKLNADEYLRLGGCMAMAEDSLTISGDLKKQLQIVKGVAIVVMTPGARPIGGAVPGYIPCQIEALTVSCLENPTLNRARPGAMTALAASERVTAILNSPTFGFVSLGQTSDAFTGTLASNAIFTTTIMLSTQTPN